MRPTEEKREDEPSPGNFTDDPSSSDRADLFGALLTTMDAESAKHGLISERKSVDFLYKSIQRPPDICVNSICYGHGPDRALQAFDLSEQMDIYNWFVIKRGVTMRKACSFIKWALVAFSICIAAPSAQAALVINPTTGASGNGEFGGVGNLVNFGGTTQLSITLGSAGTVDFTATDCCITGDAFAFKLDGLLMPWTTETYPGGVGGNFIGFLDDLLLSVGTHIFELEVTHDCCGFGGMSWSVSAATPVTQVPEPASLALLSLGLVGLGAVRRKQRVA